TWKIPHEGLKVIIVGGGLAGLTAAITLRQNGHFVKVFEQSRFANEVGAAIHMTPNATGVLTQLGVDPAKSGAVLLHQWYSASEETVMYPTSNNILLNFVCIHSAAKSETLADDDSAAGSQVKVAGGIRRVSPVALRALLAKVDPDELKLSPALRHASPPDLCVFLERGLAASEVPERLRLYNQARYGRSSKIQDLSRVVGGDKVAKITKQTNKVVSKKATSTMGFSHDEIHFSTQLPREYKWGQQPLQYRQPTVFGPSPGPRQDHRGNTFHRLFTSFHDDKNFKTSATLLRNMFPNSRYSFLKTRHSNRRLLLCRTAIQYGLAGWGWGWVGYNLLGFYIHDVCVEHQKGVQRKGTNCPVMLENLTDPIITGREELGISKLYSEIDIEESDNTCSVKISWRGNAYMQLSWQQLTPKVRESLTEHESEGSIVGRASCESDVLLANDTRASHIDARRETLPHNATFKFQDYGAESLPTLHHIVSRLAELPVFEVVGGTITEFQGVTDFSRIEILNNS
ncbi:hypothetical protein N5P37_010714, partial [Trichoderma harzianum]